MIPYLDLAIRDEAHKRELLEAVDRVLSHGRILLGPEVGQFEEAVARQCGRAHAVSVNSGTDALYLALRALDVGPGDEVITTPLSWIATLNAIALCGATPVFVDIGEDLNLDATRLEAAITARTKVILPVHYTGRLCDMTTIEAIAARHGVNVVEDAAQAFGARLNGRPAGSFGRLSCFSMNPMKVLCAYGEAGAVTTDDAALRDKLIALRYNGTINKEECHYPSINGRLDTMQAAMLLINMARLPETIARRRAIARAYTEALGDCVQCPSESATSEGVYYTYVIQVDRREALREYLQSEGIETKIHYPILMPHQPAYRHLPSADIPVAERIVGRIVSIPNHEKMTDGDVAEVVAAIRRFYGASR